MDSSELERARADVGAGVGDGWLAEAGPGADCGRDRHDVLAGDSDRAEVGHQGRGSCSLHEWCV